MFIVNSGNTRTNWEICPKLKKRQKKQHQWLRSGVFNVNHEQILYVVLVFRLSTLKKCRLDYFVRVSMWQWVSFLFPRDLHFNKISRINPESFESAAFIKHLWVVQKLCFVLAEKNLFKIIHKVASKIVEVFKPGRRTLEPHRRYLFVSLWPIMNEPKVSNLNMVCVIRDVGCTILSNIVLIDLYVVIILQRSPVRFYC